MHLHQVWQYDARAEPTQGTRVTCRLQVLSKLDRTRLDQAARAEALGQEADAEEEQVHKYCQTLHHP